MTEPRPGAGSRRRRARVAALQALYQAHVVGDEPAALAEEVAARESLPEESRSYGADLVRLVAAYREEIDRRLTGALEHWTLDRLAVVDRAVLRIAVAELLFRPEVPLEVVLDEAIEIARSFGSPRSGRFVNGVLDRVARDLREEESAS